jgi:hypothetical protein
MKAEDLQAGNPLQMSVQAQVFRHLGRNLAVLVYPKPEIDIEHTINSPTIRATFSFVCRLCTLPFLFLP